MCELTCCEFLCLQISVRSMASFAMPGSLQVLLMLLVAISTFDELEARRSFRSRYRGGSYQSAGWDQTEAIISVSVFLGFILLVVVVTILRARCCPDCSLRESVSGCIDNCKCREKRVDHVIFATNVKLKEKPKITRPPVKRHVSELRLEIQTPKQVLEKRDSKTLEKKMSLYESNPMHYRAFMEPPPAYEYIDPKETEKEKQSQFLQKRQRIHRVASELNGDHIQKARIQAQSENSKASPRTALHSKDDMFTTPGGSRRVLRTESAPRMKKVAY
ncbi:uncharacterized protein LOC125653933 [Ostrea edulis]|uniref:uncharacterized protein LOC125653933 n=1 Tax=Ostrea edulis TaxID=37623 RepID=UPI0024AF54EA|nr:uncharacterized protein LOC125653933 [Ostrea edulis]